MMNKFFDDLLT